MAYLIPFDYQVNIQDANIQQIINSDESIRTRAQLSGEAEAQSYLKQKYNISREFQDMLVWSQYTIYYAYQRVYLDANEYYGGDTYNENDLALYQGVVYTCLSNGVTGQWNAGNWGYLGKRYRVSYVKAPYPEFDYSAFYKVGDWVFWNNKSYQCKIATPILDHDTALQYRVTSNLPTPNVAPDDSVYGSQYWGTGVPYSVTGSLPDDTEVYVIGDNRDPQMVLYLCDIVLYHLHTRIAPRNIPDLRVKRYDDAIAWLRMCAEGSVTPNLP